MDLSQESCWTCKHLGPDIALRCAAFPRGIPLFIQDGQIAHEKPLPGQEGDYVWERHPAKQRIDSAKAKPDRP